MILCEKYNTTFLLLLIRPKKNAFEGGIEISRSNLKTQINCNFK